MALDIFKTLFGGSEQKSKSVSTSKPVDLTPAPFKELQRPLGGALTGLVTGGFGAVPSAAELGSSFGGGTGLFEKAITETPEAQQLRDLLMADATGATGRQGYLQDVIAGRFLPGQEGANPFYNAFFEAAARPFSTEFERTVGRVLPSRFMQAGQTVGPGETSSAFDRARAIATEGYANALKDLSSELGFKTYEAERGRQQEAVGFSQADAELMIKNYEAQLLPTFIAEWGVDQGLKEYQTRINAALDILKTAAAVTQPTIAQKAKSTATSKGETSGGIFPALFPKGLVSSGSVM